MKELVLSVTYYWPDCKTDSESVTKLDSCVSLAFPLPVEDAPTHLITDEETLGASCCFFYGHLLEKFFHFFDCQIYILCLELFWLSAFLFLTVDFIISNNQLQVSENNKKKQLANEQVS